MKKIFNKLVRDKMIDIYKHDVENKISASGYEVKYLSEEETLAKLKDKFLEESAEMLAVYELSDTEKLKEELADIIEVIAGILYHRRISLDDVLQLRELKKEKRGGFETGLFLEHIDYLDA